MANMKKGKNHWTIRMKKLLKIEQKKYARLQEMNNRQVETIAIYKRDVEEMNRIIQTQVKQVIDLKRELDATKKLLAIATDPKSQVVVEKPLLRFTCDVCDHEVLISPEEMTDIGFPICQTSGCAKFDDEMSYVSTSAMAFDVVDGYIAKAQRGQLARFIVKLRARTFLRLKDEKDGVVDNAIIEVLTELVEKPDEPF